MDDLVANSNGAMNFSAGEYILNDIIIVSVGDTLTIDSGSMIKCMPKSRLRIEGTLIANGTQSLRINFTQDPTGVNWPHIWDDHWSGIILMETSTNSHINYCDIEHASYSISIHGTSPEVTNCEIRTSLFGLSVYDPCNPIIMDCSFDVGRDAISIYDNHEITIKDGYVIANGSCIEYFHSSGIVDNVDFGTHCTEYINLTGSDIIIRNITLDYSKVLINDKESSLTINWFVKLFIYYAEGIFAKGLSYAHVLIYDKNGTLIHNKRTLGDGRTHDLECSEVQLVDKDGDGDCLDTNEIIRHTPTRFVITAEGYKKEDFDITIDSYKYIKIQMSPCPYLINNISSNHSMHEDMDDGYHLIDLEDYFSDPNYDGTLEFEIVYEEEDTLLDAEVYLHYLDLTQVEPDWYGTKSFQVKAINEDEVETESNVFNITVHPTNDEPILAEIDEKEYTGDKIEINLEEDKLSMTPFIVDDIDGDDVLVTTNITLKNFTLNVEENEIIFLSTNEDVGIRYCNMTLDDQNGSKIHIPIQFHILNTNDPPENPVILSPGNQSNHKSNVEIVFSGSCDDPDLLVPNSDEALIFKWSSNISGIIGWGPELTGLLPAGMHTIELNVGDKDGVVTLTYTEIFVEYVPPDNDINISDTDSDGLPDEWEQLHFGNLTQGAFDDYDKDGFTNLVEYQNGTDPTEPDDKDIRDEGSSVFIFLIIVVGLLLTAAIIVVCIIVFRRMEQMDEEENTEEEEKDEREERRETDKKRDKKERRRKSKPEDDEDDEEIF